MGIYFSPAAGVTLTNWSFENGKILAGPAWRDERPTYYIFYSHGLSPSSWEFWEDDAFMLGAVGSLGINFVLLSLRVLFLENGFIFTHP